VLAEGCAHSGKRQCEDCAHCKGAVSLWCTNDDAIRKRRTAIPGAINCRHWSPCERLDDMAWWQRWLAKVNPGALIVGAAE
jgi:hypothetical protein